MATHSSVLAWRIPGTGKPGGLPSMGVSQSQTQLKQLNSSSSSSNIDWLFFISYRSLLNISWIFSILVSRLFTSNSILFSRFWIILTIILNTFFSGWLPISYSFFFFFGLVGIYHAPLHAEYFSAFSFCLDCCVWGALSVGWMFMVCLYCGLAPVCGIGLD